jgi:rod shape determining protein RodA
MATALGRAMAARRPLTRLDRDPNAPWRHIDWLLVLTVGALACVGLVLVYSANYAERVRAGLDPMYWVQRQSIALAIGAVGFVVVAAVDYRRWRDLAVVLFGGTAVLLMAVLVIGEDVNGARAWIPLGAFQLQPSEFAKVTLVVGLSAYGAAARGEITSGVLARSLGIAAVPASLTMLQPDLGSTLVYGAIVMGVLLVAGVKVRHIVLCTAFAAALAVAVVSLGGLQGYQQGRLFGFVGIAETEAAQRAARHQQQSEVAIASGGTTGAGFLEGTQTNLGIVPEQHTDFIFTALGEQFGFAGSAAVLGLYGLLCLRIWRTAQMAKDLFGTLVCAGALALVVFQVFENVGMTLGIMPITGIPLPLLSYGGSSAIAFCALMGLVLNVHMRRI